MSEQAERMIMTEIEEQLDITRRLLAKARLDANIYKARLALVEVLHLEKLRYVRAEGSVTCPNVQSPLPCTPASPVVRIPHHPVRFQPSETLGQCSPSPTSRTATTRHAHSSPRTPHLAP